MNVTGRVESPANILKHPANDSTAKYQWSFSKSARFPQPKVYTQTICYDLPSTRSRRKSGFGYGGRSKCFDGKNLTNPAPTQYDRDTSFENKPDRRGYSFGKHRDMLKYANYLNQGEQTPAAYGVNQSQVRSSRAYSMRPRTAYPKNYFLPNDEDEERTKLAPGPGKYQTVDMMGSGKDFYNSKYKTQKQKSFNGGDRFSSAGRQTPGPSDYSFQNTIGADGVCLLSTMKSHGRRPILNEKRELKLVLNRENPGPGQYVKPSDFGHYERVVPHLHRPQTARN